MRLADFILANIEPILAEWEIFARSMGPGEHLNQLKLRDHAGQILQATARDMKSPQTAAEQAKKSRGLDQAQGHDALDGASKLHAVDRLGLGYGMLEVLSEYRALRASVLRLWHESAPAPTIVMSRISPALMNPSTSHLPKPLPATPNGSIRRGKCSWPSSATICAIR